MALSKYDLEDIKFHTNRYIEKLEQQLQTYKDKEDKLRELVKENEIEKLNEYHGNTYTSCLLSGYEILQILNGGKNNE